MAGPKRGGKNKPNQNPIPEARGFVQHVVSIMEKLWDDTPDDNLKRILRRVQECARDFYSREEMVDTLGEEFGEEKIGKLYDLFFSSKMGTLGAYLQVSSIRSNQRKAQKAAAEEASVQMEKQQAEQMEKKHAAEKQQAEQMEKKHAEQMEKKHAAKEASVRMEKKHAAEKQQAEQMEKQQAEQMEKKHAAEEASVRMEKKHAAEKQHAEQMEKQQAEQMEKKHAAEEASVQMEKQQAEHKKKQQAELHAALSEQVNRFASQQKLLDELISTQPAIATTEDLISFEIDIITKIDTLVEDLGSEVGAGIKAPSSSTSETVRSELAQALSVIETKYRERIQAAVTSNTIQERISSSFLQGKYDECFTMAVGADDATLAWLLSLLNPDLVRNLWGKRPQHLPSTPLLQLFPLTNETFLALLSRLTDLVLAEKGEHRGAFCRWFQAIRSQFSPPFPVVLEIPEEMMPRVLEADARVFKTHPLA